MTAQHHGPEALYVGQWVLVRMSRRVLHEQVRLQVCLPGITK